MSPMRSKWQSSHTPVENQPEGDSGVEDWDGRPSNGDLGDMFTNFGNKLSQDILPVMEVNCVFQEQEVDTRYQLDLTEIVYHLMDLSEKFR